MTRSGFYQINPGGSDDTVTSAGGDCLIINATNVTLNLNQATIAGNSSSPSGAGVHIMPKGTNAFIEGNDATIRSFAQGVEVDGVNDAVDYLTASANSNAGIYLNNAKQARVTDVIAGDLITPVNGNRYGILVSGGSYNQLFSTDSERNQIYGIWLSGTSYNSVTDFTVKNNTYAGLYLGCWNSGPQDRPCPHNKGISNYNSIVLGTALQQGNDPQQFGIAIDLGNSSNRVTGISAQFNSTEDVVDENQTGATCGGNLWFDEGTIGTDNSSCIH